MAVPAKPETVAEVVTEAIENASKSPEESKETPKGPELTDEAAFLIRRIKEEVVSGIASLLNPPKPAKEDESEDDGEPAKKRKPKTPAKKSGFGLGINLFKR